MDDFDKRLADLQKKYREAVFKESSIREASFLPVTFDICGVSVYQFSPYHYILLDFIGSPFIGGEGEIDEGRIVEFIWIVSVDFKEADDDAKKKFIIEKLSQIDYADSVKQIEEYLFDAMIDIPSSTRPKAESGRPTAKSKVPHFAWICSYIDTLCHEYGWDDEKVLQMPFAKIFQYMKAIESRQWIAAGKEPQLFNNLSDRVVREIIALQKEREEKV